MVESMNMHTAWNKLGISGLLRDWIFAVEVRLIVLASDADALGSVTVG